MCPRPHPPTLNLNLGWTQTASAWCCWMATDTTGRLWRRWSPSKPTHWLCASSRGGLGVPRAKAHCTVPDFMLKGKCRPVGVLVAGGQQRVKHSQLVSGVLCTSARGAQVKQPVRCWSAWAIPAVMRSQRLPGRLHCVLAARLLRLQNLPSHLQASAQAVEHAAPLLTWPHMLVSSQTG